MPRWTERQGAGSDFPETAGAPGRCGIPDAPCPAGWTTGSHCRCCHIPDDEPSFWQAARAVWRRPRALARLLHAEVTHLAWRTGLRGYCWPCDRLRWAWTHRRCQARQHEAAAEWLAANPWVLNAAKQALRDRSTDDG